MKILNREYRDITSGESLLKTPVSELDETSNLFDKSLIHIIECRNENDDSPTYDSKKMLLGDFKQKVYEAVQNTFKTSYWDTHCRDCKDGVVSPPANDHETVDEPGESQNQTSFKNLVSYLKGKGYEPSEVSDDDQNGFIKHIYYDFDVIKRYMVLKDGDLNTLITGHRDRLTRIECLFRPDSKIWTFKRSASDATPSGETELTNDSVKNQNVNDRFCHMQIEPGNKISNTWSCPSTGMLVAYGWLDSSSALNNKAIPSAFCVLEGKSTTYFYSNAYMTDAYDKSCCRS